MLVLLALYACISGICQVLGLGLSRAFGWHFRNRACPSLLGMLLVAVAARWYSLWQPLAGPFVGGVVLVALATAGLTGQRFPAIRWKKAGYVLPVLLLLLAFQSQQSISYDEALYHAAFIQWTTDWGTVKGLANLHGRLGFNSTWHVFAGAFNFDWLFRRPLNAVNGWLALWAAAYFLEEYRLKNASRTGRAAAWIAAALFFPVLLVYHLIDPSADYAALVLTLVALHRVFAWQELTDPDEARSFGMLLPVLLAFLLTVKLSCVPVLLLGLILFSAPLQRRHWLQLLLLCGIVAAPWFLANYRLCGYLVYPYLPLKGTAVPWRVPLLQAAAEAQGIRWTPFQRWTGWSYSQLEHASVFSRYRVWFGGIRPLDKIFFALTPCGLLLLAIRHRAQKGRILALATALAGFGVALWTAPDFRFIAPYAFFGAALGLASVERLRPAKPLLTVLVCGQLGVTLFLYHRLKPKVNNPAANYHPSLAFNPLFPEPYPVSRYSRTNLDGQRLFLFDEREREFNWNAIPGAYVPLRPDLHLLDSTSIGGGFFQSTERIRP